MTDTVRHCPADDYARLMLILANGPTEGLGIEEIQALTKTGETWSFRTINTLLCEIRPRIEHEKLYVRGKGKVTKYRLRSA